MNKSLFNSARVTTALFVPLLLLTVFLAGYYAVKPSYRSMRESRLKLQEKREALARNSESLADIKTLIEEFKTRGSELASVDDALPEAPAVPELLANLDEIGKKSGMAITQISITLPENAPSKFTSDESQGPRLDRLLSATRDLGIMQVDINVTGTYSNLKTFLTNLEQNLRLTDVLYLTMASSGEEGDSQQYVLKVNSYFQK